MKRNLIIIGGGILQVPLIRTAKEMGLCTIVFDMSGTAPGIQEADQAVLMSTRDIEGCVREAKIISRSRPVHGVVTAGTDASRAVAAIAGALELPGIRYQDAEAASNKVLMRKRLQRHGVPVPKFFSVWSLRDAREAMDEMTFPLVLKPAENMGARGVIKVRSRGEIRAAFQHAKACSPTGEMILEEFMPGPELSVDALAWKNNFRITGIADRIIEHEPYFIESGHNMPSQLPHEILTQAADVMRRGMDALGIHTGAGKGDLKVTPQGIMVGEIAGRLSGGFMSSHTYPLHSGVDLLRAAVEIALGEEPRNLEPVRNLVAIERGILAVPGKIVSLTGLEEMKETKGVEEAVFTRKVGDLLPQPTSNIDKVGHVVVCAPTLGEAEAAANDALSKAQILMDESYSVDWKRIEEQARLRFGEQVCWVCKSCDGNNCASGVPGMGGVGRMNSFLDNSKALAEYKIVPRYIRKQIQADPAFELFGRKFEFPILGAPMTGAVTNMNGAVTELEFAQTLLAGCREVGSVAWVGDGASPEKYKIILQALEEQEGFGVAIFKPRADTDALLERFRAAETLPVLAVGMDIDALSFKTMVLRNQGTIARDTEALRMLRDSVRLPFVLKGVLSPEDAEAAVSAGVDAIVVSNHGGRVLDEMPGTARVLPEIVSVVNGRIPVLADGGVRSGLDAFKMLALGAKAVLVGRPLAIAAVGGGVAAVNYREELRKAMNLCGAETPAEISPDYLVQTKEEEDSPARGRKG